MYAEAHQYDKAAPELEKAVSLKSDDAALQISLGDAYLNLGQDDKALAAFDRATEISATPEVWNNIAYQLSLKKAHLDRAQQYAESAVTAVSNSLRNLSLDQLSDRDLGNVSALDADWDTLGWVYFARGDLAKAQKYVDAAWTLGEHGEVGDHLAEIYEKRGQKDDAIRTYAMSLSGLRPALETKGTACGVSWRRRKRDQGGRAAPCRSADVANNSSGQSCACGGNGGVLCDRQFIGWRGQSGGGEVHQWRRKAEAADR